MEELPRDMLKNILLNLDLKDILIFCQVKRAFKGICEEPYFWEQLLQKNYPLYYKYPPFPLGGDWKDDYEKIYHHEILNNPVFQELYQISNELDPKVNFNIERDGRIGTILYKNKLLSNIECYQLVPFIESLRKQNILQRTNIGKICPNIHYYYTEGKKRETEEDIAISLETIIQPQGENYGLNKKLKPTKNFSYFLENKNLVFEHTLYTMKYIVSRNDLFGKLVSKILINKNICQTGLFLIGEIDDIQDFKLVTKATIYNAFGEVDIINITNQNFESKIIQCVQDGFDYIYINIYIAIDKNVSREKIFRADHFHSFVVVLNLMDRSNPKFLNIDSSLPNLSSNYFIYESILISFLKKYLRQVTNIKNISYLSFEEESCPKFDIQGKTGTCAYFSLYLIFLYILNKSRKKIFETFKNIKQEERLKLLSQFSYFVYNSLKDHLIPIRSEFTSRDVKNFLQVWEN